MPSSDKGFIQAYNGQAAVDVTTMLIVESHISQTPNNKQEITPTLASLDELPEELGKIDTILADAYVKDRVNLSRFQLRLAANSRISDKCYQLNQKLTASIRFGSVL
jgi:hypothetical protein